MSTEVLKAIFRRVFEEVWSQGALNVVDEIYAAEYVLHNPAAPEVSGREALKQLVTAYRAAFPDLQFTVDEMIAEGDRVAARWKITGTQEGEWMGTPPTGRQVEVAGMSMVRITGGRVVEDFGSIDMLGLMQQLGAIPRMGAGEE